jgi:hypothetical protein
VLSFIDIKFLFFLYTHDLFRGLIFSSMCNLDFFQSIICVHRVVVTCSADVKFCSLFVVMIYSMNYFLVPCVVLIFSRANLLFLL